jgi:thioredoxin-related protein
MDKPDLADIRHRLHAQHLIILILFLLTTAVSALASDDTDSRDPREYFFTQSFGDMPEELKTAREQGKQGLLLFFEAEGCPYCLAMLKRVLNQKDVQDWYQEHFLSIAIDIHGDVEIKDFDGITLPSKVFSEQRRVYMTPQLSFIDLDGNEIYRHLGMVKTPQEFLVMGEYITGKHYFDTEFKVFAKKQGMQQGEDILVTPMEESATKHRYNKE